VHAIYSTSGSCRNFTFCGNMTWIRETGWANLRLKVKDYGHWERKCKKNPFFAHNSFDLIQTETTMIFVHSTHMIEYISPASQRNFFRDICSCISGPPVISNSNSDKNKSLYAQVVFTPSMPLIPGVELFAVYFIFLTTLPTYVLYQHGI